MVALELFNMVTLKILKYDLCSINMESDIRKEFLISSQPTLTGTLFHTANLNNKNVKVLGRPDISRMSDHLYSLRRIIVKLEREYLWLRSTINGLRRRGDAADN